MLGLPVTPKVSREFVGIGDWNPPELTGSYIEYIFDLYFGHAQIKPPKLYATKSSRAKWQLAASSYEDIVGFNFVTPLGFNFVTPLGFNIFGFNLSHLSVSICHTSRFQFVTPLGFNLSHLSSPIICHLEGLFFDPSRGARWFCAAKFFPKWEPT